jgi:hypothetical protein
MVRRHTTGRLVMFATAVLVATAATGCDPGAKLRDHVAPSTVPTPTLTGTLPPVRAGAFNTNDRGPTPPATGTWFGAYADPYNQTVVKKNEAISTFQTLIGRDLDIVHSFHPWSDDVPSQFDYDIARNGQIDLLSWAGTDTVSLASGVYDSRIERTAIAIRDMHAPLLLRFRWEMERPNLASTVHSPEAFIAAWKHVRAIFTAVGATNAAWVWCPLATGFALGTAQAYYPGDDQVDWICADVYPGDEMTSFAAAMAPVMDFARNHPHPVLIGEFGVEQQPANGRAAWFTDMAAVLHAQPQIKAIVYNSTNQRSKPFHDYTLDASPTDLAAYRAVADDPYFNVWATK